MLLMVSYRFLYYWTKLVLQPNISAQPGYLDISQDITKIRDIIAFLVEYRKTVVLFMYSDSSISGAKTTRDLGKQDRSRNNGLVKLILAIRNIQESI